MGHYGDSYEEEAKRAKRTIAQQLATKHGLDYDRCMLQDNSVLLAVRVELDKASSQSSLYQLINTLKGDKAVDTRPVVLEEIMLLPNGDTVSIYRNRTGHYLSVVTDCSNRTVAIAWR